MLAVGGMWRRMSEMPHEPNKVIRRSPAWPRPGDRTPAKDVKSAIGNWDTLADIAVLASSPFAGLHHSLLTLRDEQPGIASWRVKVAVVGRDGALSWLVARLLLLRRLLLLLLGRRLRLQLVRAAEVVQRDHRVLRLMQLRPNCFR